MFSETCLSTAWRNEEYRACTDRESADGLGLKTLRARDKVTFNDKKAVIDLTESFADTQ